MAIENPEDAGVAISFVFRTSDIAEHQQWVKEGYFESSEDVAAHAFTMLRDVMRHLIQEKKVKIRFDAITIDMEFEIPPGAQKTTLQ